MRSNPGSPGCNLLKRVKQLLIPLYTVGLLILLPLQFYLDIRTDRYGVRNEETKDHRIILLCRGTRRSCPEIWERLHSFG